MKIILLLTNILFITNLFSQNTNDSVFIKINGNTETAYYKQIPQQKAWIKHLNNQKKTVGVYLEYYKNGKLKRKIVYNTKGIKHGEYMEFAPDGSISVSGMFKNGKKHGLWQYFKLKRNEVYKNGKKHGRWRIYEGTVPWSLYIYKHDSLIRVKKYTQSI